VHAFTGEVVDQSTSSETHTTVHSNNQVTSRTDHYTHLFVRAPSGEECDLEVANLRMGVRRQHTVTLLWGIRKGKEQGPYVAVNNHDTKSIHHIRKGNNDLAGPPGYNLLLVVAVMVGVFGLFGVLGGSMGAAVPLLLGVGAVYWVYSRQRKLMAAVEAAARGIGVRAMSAAATSP
jgi:hypothetical protein